MKKRIVGILYGGRSVEHGVSVNSGRNIFDFIDRELFEPVAIGITSNGKWFQTEGVVKEIENGKELSLNLDSNRPEFRKGLNDQISLDIIFSVLHGTDGEDGSVQGLLKSLGIPIVGTGVLGSALCMNKVIAKQLLSQAGIPVTRFVSFHSRDKGNINFGLLQQLLGLPFMVKSASLGSSVGVSKVKSENDFLPALQEAFRYDTEILIEEFIMGREIECSVLGNDPPVASLPGEIVVGSNYEFYTFDAKYVDPDAVKIQVPAQLDPSTLEKIRNASVEAFQTLRCQDFARVDLFLTQNGNIFINEINTIPGFTNSSMFPMMWKERGISFKDLITGLLEIAFERCLKESTVSRSFNSDLNY